MSGIWINPWAMLSLYHVYITLLSYPQPSPYNIHHFYGFAQMLFSPGIYSILHVYFIHNLYHSVKV